MKNSFQEMNLKNPLHFLIKPFAENKKYSIFAIAKKGKRS